jgi:hypothetical protein
MEYSNLNYSEILHSLLKGMNSKTNEEIDSFIHAIVDIEESFLKIYSILIKEILDNQSNYDLIQDRLWEIREEFRHIDYHINDAKLTE